MGRPPKKPEGMSDSDDILCRIVVKEANPTPKILDLHPELKTEQAAASYLRNKLQDCNIKERITDLLDRQGLNLDFANKKLKKLLEAQRPVVFEGKITEQYDDNGIQLMALERLYKLHGLLQSNSTQIYAQQNNMVMSSDSSPESIEKLKCIIDEMSCLASKLDLTKNRIYFKGDVKEVINATEK